MAITSLSQADGEAHSLLSPTERTRGVPRHRIGNHGFRRGAGRQPQGPRRPGGGAWNGAWPSGPETGRLPSRRQVGRKAGDPRDLRRLGALRVPAPTWTGGIVRPEAQLARRRGDVLQRPRPGECRLCADNGLPLPLSLSPEDRALTPGDGRRRHVTLTVPRVPPLDAVTANGQPAVLPAARRPLAVIVPPPLTAHVRRRRDRERRCIPSMATVALAGLSTS